MSPFLVHGVLLWPLFVVLAIVNGLVRDTVYGPHMSEYAAHQLSVVPLILAILAVTYIILSKSPIPPSGKEYILLGACWLCLTVAFEFLFGRYVVGDSWESLLSAYNIFAGQLWILVPLTMLLAPSLMARIQKAFDSHTAKPL